MPLPVKVFFQLTEICTDNTNFILHCDKTKLHCLGLIALLSANQNCNIFSPVYHEQLMYCAVYLNCHWLVKCNHKKFKPYNLDV